MVVSTGIDTDQNHWIASFFHEDFISDSSCPGSPRHELIPLTPPTAPTSAQNVTPGVQCVPSVWHTSSAGAYRAGAAHT